MIPQELLGDLSADDRGVSEVINYILLLGIALSAITLTTALGVPVVTEQADAQIQQNVEHGFTNEIGAAITAVSEGRAPSRAGVVRANDGVILGQQDERYRVEVTVEDADGNILDTHTFEGEPITYRRGSFEMHYEAGAVIRVDSGEERVVDSPRLGFTDSSSHMSVISTNISTPRRAVTGTRDITLVATGTDEEAWIYADQGPVTVTVTITSDRFRAWQGHLDSAGYTVSVDETSQTVSFSTSTANFAVRESQVHVTQDREDESW